MTELRISRRSEREGTVEALGDTDIHATPERSATSRAVHPRYRMQLRCLRCHASRAVRRFWTNQGGTAEQSLRPWRDRGGAFFYAVAPNIRR